MTTSAVNCSPFAMPYLEAGDSLDEFLEDYPTVTRKQAVAFIEKAGKHLLDSIAATA